MDLGVIRGWYKLVSWGFREFFYLQQSTNGFSLVGLLRLLSFLPLFLVYSFSSSYWPDSSTFLSAGKDLDVSHRFFYINLKNICEYIAYLARIVIFLCVSKHSGRFLISIFCMTQRNPSSEIRVNITSYDQ